MKRSLFVFVFLLLFSSVWGQVIDTLKVSKDSVFSISQKLVPEMENFLSLNDTIVLADPLKKKQDSIKSIERFVKPIQGKVVDFAPDYDDEIIESRIANTFSDVPLRYNNRIRGFIDYFTIRNRDYTRKMIKRADAYFPIMEEVLAKNNMPESIKYLAIVESGLDPKIRSWAGAMGLWQFMPATGRAYHLNYDYYIDERLDPYKATDAACKYLKVLYDMFGDWELALGAYNCGPGNMRKAIRKSGYKKTFAEVYNYLPKETRSYVPQFMAVNYVMRYAKEHNLYVEDWEKEYLPDSDTIECSQYLDLNKLTELSGVCKEYIIQLNPSIKRDAVSKEWKGYKLALPKEFDVFSKDSIQAMFLASSEKGDEELNYAYKNPNAGDLTGSTKVRYRVRAGDNLGSIASKYKVRVKDVRSWNNLKGSTIYPGQRLTIYQKGVHKNGPPKNTTSGKTTKVTKVIEVEKGKSVVHVVQKGEVLGTIASKYGVLVSQLKSWNKLKSSRINVGQKLTVYDKNKVNEEVPVSNKIYHSVRKGEVLGTIASLHNVKVAEIKKWNNLSSNNIKIGQRLVIYSSQLLVDNPLKTSQSNTSNSTYDKEKSTTLYVVKKGDVLYNIALDYDMSVSELKGLNNLSNNKIDIGDKLKVYKKTTVATVQKQTVSSSDKIYVVKSGDSLWNISKKTGVSIDALKEINNLNSNALKPGMELKY